MGVHWNLPYPLLIRNLFLLRSKMILSHFHAIIMVFTVRKNFGFFLSVLFQIFTRISVYFFLSFNLFYVFTSHTSLYDQRMNLVMKLANQNTYIMFYICCHPFHFVSSFHLKGVPQKWVQRIFVIRLITELNCDDKYLTKFH